MSEVQFSGSCSQNSGSQGRKSGCQGPSYRVLGITVPCLSVLESQVPEPRVPDLGSETPGSRVSGSQGPGSQVSGPDFRLSPFSSSINVKFVTCHLRNKRYLNSLNRYRKLNINLSRNLKREVT